MPQSRSVPDVREKRRNWKKHMSEKDINHLVFLDESGADSKKSATGRTGCSPEYGGLCGKWLWMVIALDWICRM